MAQIVSDLVSQVTTGVTNTYPGVYRERPNIRTLCDLFDQNNKKPLSDVLRAFSYIQTKLPPEDRNSFFMIAGYHGEPFRGAGWGNPQWWGGYCMHGNVLFPTWHRAYLWRLENALRSVKGCETVALPYVDWTEPRTLQTGLPWIFLRKTVTLDTGETIKNPLYSYKFQAPVYDNLAFPPILGAEFPNPDYYKNENYETCRFPFSGFVAPPGESDNEHYKKIEAYNAKYKAMSDSSVDGILNGRIKEWLVGSTGKNPIQATAAKFKACLDAPNYTVFSNTTSAVEWNQRYLKSTGGVQAPKVMPLESPHNDMHLAVGGFNVPGLGDTNDPDPNKPGPYTLANGDMGENETAGFDPIFFFHHCFVDKCFWDWQVKHKKANELEIIKYFPGTNSVDNQGPTPGIAGGSWLTMDTPLDPFTKNDAEDGPPMTSRDVVNIIQQLRYGYAEGQQTAPDALFEAVAPTHHLKVSGVNRGNIGGSFVIAAYKKPKSGGDPVLLGYESVLSRWHVAGCANCQTHLNHTAFIPLRNVTPEDERIFQDPDEENTIEPRLIMRDALANGRLAGGASRPQLVSQLYKTA